MDEVLAALAQFASELSYRDLPPNAVIAGKERLVDALGCAIGAYDCETAAIGRRIAGPPPARESSGRFLGSSAASTADAAAFVNSCMIRYLDFNDSVKGGGSHPGDMLGAHFAVAPQLRAGGERLVTAVVAAYEVVMRVNAFASVRDKGWDQGFGISIGAAAGLANLLGLGAEATRHAIAITAVANTPMRATRSGQLSMWKGAAAAYAVRNAVFGVQLAASGMTGPEAPFTGRHGYAELISGPITLQPFGSGPDDFMVARHVCTKLWPVSYGQQAIVWAGIELRKQLPVARIASIAVHTYHFVWFESGSEPAKWDPRTRETADHSIPFILVQTLLHGGIDKDTFVPEVYLDPSIRPLMNAITVSVDEALEKEFQADGTHHVRIVAKDVDGKTYELDIVNPMGHYRNPQSTEEISAKFLRLCRPRLGEARAQAALAHWRNIETAPDVEQSFDLLDVAAH